MILALLRASEFGGGRFRRLEFWRAIALSHRLLCWPVDQALPRRGLKFDRRSIRSLSFSSSVISTSLILMLSGCDGPASKRELLVPAVVRAMMTADFPADGRVHVRARGKFRIERDTPACFYPEGFGIASEDLFKPLGQSPITNEGDRQQPATMDRCHARADTVFIKGVKSDNREGRPYRLVLSVWQQGAVWVGGLERMNGLRPDQKAGRPFRDGLPPLTYLGKRGQDRDDKKYRNDQSSVSDITDITKRFVSDLLRTDS